jgi:hypothetical protein
MSVISDIAAGVAQSVTNPVGSVVGGVAGLIDTLVTRVWPDKAAQKQASDQMQLQLLQMEQTGELEQFKGNLAVTLAQIDVNKTEAQNTSVFVSGGRPAVLWVCVGGLAYQMLLRPFMEWGSAAWWHVPAPPSLDMGTLGTLLAGLLGIGAMHMNETIQANRSGK